MGVAISRRTAQLNQFTERCLRMFTARNQPALKGAKPKAHYPSPPVLLLGSLEKAMLSRTQTIARALKYLADEMRTRSVLKDPTTTKNYLKLLFADLEHEVFVVVYLDNQHQVIEHETLSRGTIDGAAVYPREVVKACLKANAAAVIFAHPHPSGIAEPSAADRSLTERLKAALALVDIRVLDHFVIGHNDAVSFAERGWL